MPSSMTGFGQADAHGYHVEIKSVNHRYKDIRVKMPRDLAAFEMSVRDMVSEAVHRGKVDVTVSRTPSMEAHEKMAVNWDLAKAYYDDLCIMARDFGGEVSFRDILLVPGVLSEGPAQRDDQQPLVREAVHEVLSFTGPRERGGEPGPVTLSTGQLTRMTGHETCKAHDKVYKDRLHASSAHFAGRPP